MNSTAAIAMGPVHIHLQDTYLLTRATGRMTKKKGLPGNMSFANGDKYQGARQPERETGLGLT